MIQLIPAAQRKPSFGQRLSQGVGQGLEAAGQYMDKRQEEERQIMQSQQASKLAGMDLSGLSPEMQKVALQEALKGKSKEALFDKKQDFFKRLNLGDEKSEMAQEDTLLDLDNQSSELYDEPRLDESKPAKKSSAKQKKPQVYTQSQILEANAVDPSGQTGRSMEQSNKQTLSQQRHEQNLGLEQEKQAKTDFQKDREFHTQFSKPVIENANNVLAAAPAKKGIIRQWKRDIASGNTSGLGNFMADKTGLEFWRTPESARAKAAGKEYFVESLRTLAPGARPNQFIEQQLVAAQPAIGRDVESGMAVIEMQEYLDDLKDKSAELELKMAEKDREKYGYAKQDIRERARKELTAYAEERQNQLAYNIRQHHENTLDDKALSNEIVLGQITPGTPLTERMAAILMLKNNDDPIASKREAQRLGFELPRKPK